jgi:hypothetical protein
MSEHTPHMMAMQQLQGNSPAYGKEEFRKLQDIIDNQADRLLALESALREIKDQYLPPYQSSAIAKSALEYKSPIPVKPGVNAV